MELYLSIFFFSVAVLFLLRYRSHSAFMRRLPPGPTSFPIIGSLHRLGPHPNHSLFELAKLHGPLMTLRLGSIITVVASTPETAKEILQFQDQSFSERHLPEAVAVQPDPEWTLAWAVGDSKWRSRRRVCTTKLFTSHGLSSSEEVRHRKVQQLIDHIAKQSTSGIAINIGELAFATALNLISTTIFSVDMVDPEFAKAGEFKDLVWRIMEDSGRLNLSDYFPALKRFDFQGIRRHIKPSYTRLHEIFDEMIQTRVYEIAEGVRRVDFLDVLLDHCVDGSDFTPQNIKPMILDLFIAGSDTSAITTEWAMAELLKNPHLMHKAKQELTQVIGQEQKVKESHLENLPYLHAIFKETLRLHPPVPLLLPYKATNDVEISGYTIPKGAQVLINAWAIGRHPSYWDEPTAFCPERFLQDSSMDYKGRDFGLIPFGAGRRICPGLPLAARMVQLMLASLLHSFDWELPEDQLLNMEEQWGTTLKKAVRLCAVPKPLGASIVISP